MTTSNNRLIMVATMGLKLSAKYRQPYSCAKSPHEFTQPKQMTCSRLRVLSQDHLSRGGRVFGCFASLARGARASAIASPHNSQAFRRSNQCAGDCRCHFGRRGERVFAVRRTSSDRLHGAGVDSGQHSFSDSFATPKTPLFQDFCGGSLRQLASSRCCVWVGADQRKS